MGRSSVTYAILGIGLNVNQKREDFPSELRNQAISLRMVSNQIIDRLHLLLNLLTQLEKNYTHLMNQETDSIFQKIDVSGCCSIDDVSGVNHVAGC